MSLVIQVRRDEVVGLPAPHLPGGEADQSQNQELLKSFPRTCENFERIERMLNFYRVAQSFGRFEPSHANCGRGLFVMLMPLISVSVSF